MVSINDNEKAKRKEAILLFLPSHVYYEEKSEQYELGKRLLDRYRELNIPTHVIDNHNNIPELRSRPNSDFPAMKRCLIIGTRKTHRYTPNQKVSDFLVPYTSSGCTAMCLYCYLVCNYNKCSYLRLFVNREEMLDRLMRTARKPGPELTFEIGSNSDLVLENTITGNLEWTISRFGQAQSGYLTFPTKFDDIDPLLSLEHRGRTIPRMSVNPQSIISRIELGTSPLQQRIAAVNRLCEAGYPVGILIAPVIMVEDWKDRYRELVEILSQQLSSRARGQVFFEVIFMTYSYVHRMINAEAFPKAPELFHTDQMTGRGMGKYYYRPPLREDGEQFLRDLLGKEFPENRIVYIV